MTPYAHLSSSSTDRVCVILLFSVPTRTELYAASPLFYASRPPSVLSVTPNGPSTHTLPLLFRPAALGFSSCTGPPTTNLSDTFRILHRRANHPLYILDISPCIVIRVLLHSCTPLFQFSSSFSFYFSLSLYYLFTLLLLLSMLF